MLLYLQGKRFSPKWIAWGSLTRKHQAQRRSLCQSFSFSDNPRYTNFKILCGAKVVDLFVHLYQKRNEFQQIPTMAHGGSSL